ncbi:hypothetical protein AArc1_3177 [Natrarchaeobaculum sulfurireducens]|uniref:Uncharacterized protein n=1 Tax=Natrarchaeobaculum sulfurireducens TaxID=2044521 RepID=A0A346PIY7_9EURY|nr:hypothetical protein AArc1_3177 [Natrarchaeobaculum sulfurireducens]
MPAKSLTRPRDRYCCRTPYDSQYASGNTGDGVFVAHCGDGRRTDGSTWPELDPFSSREEFSRRAQSSRRPVSTGFATIYT